MGRVLLIPTLLLLLLGALCFALSGGGVRAGIPKTITIANMDEIKTLDVGRMSWQADIRTAMVEGLIEARLFHDGQMVFSTSPAGNYPNVGRELARCDVRDIPDPGPFIAALLENAGAAGAPLPGDSADTS